MKAILDSFAGKRDDFQSRLKSHYKNWFQAVKDSDDVVPYIATPTNWKPNCTSGKGNTILSVLKGLRLHFRVRMYHFTLHICRMKRQARYLQRRIHFTLFNIHV